MAPCAPGPPRRPRPAPDPANAQTPPYSPPPNTRLRERDDAKTKKLADEEPRESRKDRERRAAAGLTAEGRAELVPMLRDVSRQEYLAKREADKLAALEDEIRDEEFLFAGAWRGLGALGLGAGCTLWGGRGACAPAGSIAGAAVCQCARACAHMLARPQTQHTRMRARTHTHTHTHTRARARAHTHTHTQNTDIRTHTRSRIHTPFQARSTS
jgi:hypothetical protein